MKIFVKTPLIRSIIIFMTIILSIIYTPVVVQSESWTVGDAYFQGVHLIEVEQDYDAALQIFHTI